ncbi:MAG: hypothetical protein AB8G99_20175 [Planctomycetaceae bacterium]
MGEFLTRAFVWIALLGYSVSSVRQLNQMSPTATRRWWVMGAVAFVLHVAFAFHVFHDWSHVAALKETAKQTKELTGVSSGSGLYLNYVFTLIWVVDAIWWHVVGHERYARRVKWVPIAIHVFFIFMIVNGAIVFGKGPVRWYGGVLVAMMLVAMMLVAFILRKRGSSVEGMS